MRYCYLFVFLVWFSCKAQNIVPYDSDEDIFVPNSGDYYKDTNNLFNTFVGEWTWQNVFTGSSLTIILKKVVNIDEDLGYTADLLVGEYQYVENGVELVNTLSDIDNPNITGSYHKIVGVNIITKYVEPQCSDCLPNEKRMTLDIKHDDYELVYNKLIIRRIMENGLEKLKVIVQGGVVLSIEDNVPSAIDVPHGEYILTKVD